MSQKSPEHMFDKVVKPKEEIIRTINGAFSFKGEKIYPIAKEFHDWCEATEKKFDVVLISNRADYNGYWPIDRTRIKE